MNTIIFNETECGVNTFNMTAYFSATGEMNGTISCEISSTDAGALLVLGTEPITSVVIKHDDDVIYNLTEATAHLESINEFLDNDRIVINMSIRL